jgi:DNA-binding MarR family transcriptional regulator
VDRLERAGLAERRSLATDRRVKLVVLTAKGERTGAELLAEFHRPPSELLRLGERDLVALRRALDKLAG